MEPRPRSDPDIQAQSVQKIAIVIPVLKTDARSAFGTYPKTASKREPTRVLARTGGSRGASLFVRRLAQRITFEQKE
jgi:hypothetical protein